MGGTPAHGVPPTAGVVEGSPGSSSPPLRSPAGPALPGEGQWRTVVAVNGRPAVQVTALRPDRTHTSFLVGVMRLDPGLVRGQLHPGTLDPGGHWQASTSLAGAAGAGVAAAFNGGFRLTDPSHNGYYSEGRTVAPLVDGRASLVLHTDGTADVGSWDREVRMDPTVASSTVGQAAYIDRSGFGVTATGAEIYVGGPALSVCTLGAVLADAGVVRGMELDINPDWVSGTYNHDSATGPAQGFPLFPDERVPPQHYLVASSRDWYAWYARS